jgi:dihydrolipoamide dehydrogenase
LPNEDADVSEAISANFEAKGVVVHHGATLESLKVVDGQVEYVVKCGREGKLETIRVEKALLSIGRVPNLSGIGLENTSCTVKDGVLMTHDCQTTVPHIWAAGDATIDIALVNIAEYEARHVVERIWGSTHGPQSYDNVSTIMFLDPTVAASGMNEQSLQRQKIPYRVARFAYPLVSRAVAKRTTNGFVKLIVSLDSQPRVLGIRALGTHASSIVDLGSMVCRESSPLDDSLFSRR